MWIWHVDVLPMWISFLDLAKCGYHPYVGLWISYLDLAKCGYSSNVETLLCGFSSYVDILSHVDLAKCGYPSCVDILLMGISFLCGFPIWSWQKMNIHPMWISFLCGFLFWLWQKVDIPPMWRLYYVNILPMWISFLCGVGGIDYCSTWNAELPAWFESLYPGTRSFWAFKLNLILSNYATSHLRTCLKSFHRCQLLPLPFFSVDLRLWSSWRTTLSTTHLELVLWFLPLLPIPRKRTTSWRMPFNYCIALAHLLTDLQALSLLNGYGNITLTPCRTSSWNFPKYKLFTASLKPETYEKISLCDIVKRWLEHPALLAGCVCVYLLKRSKTCTSCGCWT